MTIRTFQIETENRRGESFEEVVLGVVVGEAVNLVNGGYTLSTPVDHSF